MTTPLLALIADDESKAREKLQRLLAAHADVTIVGSVSNGREVVDAVRSLHPHVVFLDIRMPELDGFQALATLRDIVLPQIVFVTAFDEYAARAFEVRALDYLLKPYDDERLADTLSRVRERIADRQRPDGGGLQALLGDLNTPPGPLWTIEPPEGARYVERLCIRSPGNVQVVRTTDVHWIEAYGNYVRLHTNDGRPLLRESMRHLVEKLDPNRFARVHRSAIVNLDRVRQLKPTPSGDYILSLESGTRLKLSRSFRASLEAKLEGR